jgi:hypothetical protein
MFMLQGVATLSKSNKWSMITDSSSERKCISSSDPASQGKWLHHLLNDLKDLHPRDLLTDPPERCGIISTTDPLPLLYIDNHSYMKIVMSTTSKVHEEMKHIDVHHHFV